MDTTPPESPTKGSGLNDTVVKELNQDSDLSDEVQADGGLQAWLTVLGGWLIYFCGLGYFNSYGVYQDFYVREFMTNKTPSEIAWIGSFQIMLQFLLGIPVGKAFDAGYFHHLMISGSIIYCFSLFMLSLAKPQQYYQVFLAQGVGMGLGLALTFLPALSVMSHHFTRRRSLAIGIMTSGASIGGILFPIMLNKLIFGRQGFFVGVRATAGLITGLMALGNLLMRTRPPRLRDINVKPRRTSTRSLFRDLPYMMTVVSGIFVTLGIFYPIFYLQLFSIKHGIDENLAFYTVSLVNAGGVLGRLIPSFFADRIGTFNVSIPVIFTCAASILALLGTHNAAGVVIVSLLYGAMNAAYIALTPALLSDISNDVSEVGIRMGLWFSFIAVPSLFGQPISGALVKAEFIWWRGTVFAGICLIAGGMMLMIARYLFLRGKGISQFHKI